MVAPMTRALPSPTGFAAPALAGLGVLMLAGALAFQHIGGLAPCALCIEQRKAWAAVIVLALLAIAAGRLGWRRAATAGLVLAAVAALTGAGVALFHVGVEQQWWPGTASCGAGFETFGQGSVADMRERLLARPVVRCDEVAWSMLGISMAGWNGLIALAAGLAGLWTVKRDFSARKPGR